MKLRKIHNLKPNFFDDVFHFVIWTVGDFGLLKLSRMKQQVKKKKVGYDITLGDEILQLREAKPRVAE